MNQTTENNEKIGKKRQELYLLSGQIRAFKTTTRWPLLSDNLYGQWGKFDRLQRFYPADSNIYIYHHQDFALITSDLPWLLSQVDVSIEKSLLPWVLMLGQLPAPQTVYREITTLPLNCGLELLPHYPYVRIKELPAPKTSDTAPVTDTATCHRLFGNAIKKSLHHTKNADRAIAFSCGLPSAYLLCQMGPKALTSYTISSSGSGPLFDQHRQLKSCPAFFPQHHFKNLKPDITKLTNNLAAAPLPVLSLEGAIFNQLALTAKEAGMKHLFSGLGGAELFGRTPLQHYLAQLDRGHSFKQVCGNLPQTPWLQMGRTLLAKKSPWLLPATILATPGQLLETLSFPPLGQAGLTAVYQQPLRFLGFGQTKSSSLEQLWSLLYNWELDSRRQIAGQTAQMAGVKLHTPYLEEPIIQMISPLSWEQKIINGIPGQLLINMASGHIPDQLLKKKHIYPTLPLPAIFAGAGFAALSNRALESGLWDQQIFRREKYLQLLASRQQYRLVWALTILALWWDNHNK